MLTNRAHLPVTKLNFGASDGLYRYSWINYSLGHLRCYGKAENVEYPSSMAKNRINKIEENVEVAQSQIDSLKNATEKVKTEMDKKYPSSMAENRIKKIEDNVEKIQTEMEKKTISYFAAAATTHYSSAGTAIPFPKILAEENSELDHATGIVTIVVDGVYHFATSLTQYSSWTAIYIKHNDQVVCWSGGDSDKSNQMMPCAVTIKAKKNDKIAVYLDRGQICFGCHWANPNNVSSTFTGFLLTET